MKHPIPSTASQYGDHQFCSQLLSRKILFCAQVLYGVHILLLHTTRKMLFGVLLHFVFQMLDVRWNLPVELTIRVLPVQPKMDDSARSGRPPLPTIMNGHIWENITTAEIPKPVIRPMRYGATLWMQIKDGIIAQFLSVQVDAYF